MGGPVPARGRSTGRRQQPRELVPVAPTAEKGWRRAHHGWHGATAPKGQPHKENRVH